MTQSTHARLLTLVAIATMLAACDKVSHPLAARAFAAKVNGTVITLTQVDQERGRQPILGISNQPWPTTAAVLEELIGQELILQKAREARIDRDPEVLQATEAARRAALSNAWLRSTAGTVPAPTDQEIEDYLQQHPELASERRFFNWRSASLQASVAQITDIQQQLANTKDFDQVLRYLDGHNLRYISSEQSAASDHLSAEALRRLRSVGSGDTTLFADGDRLEMVHLMSEYAAPIDAGPMRPAVEKILKEQRAKDSIEARVASLRGGARIEFVGDFKALEPVRPNAAVLRPEAKMDVAHGIALGLQ